MKNVLITLFTSLLAWPLFAQKAPNIIAPSPNASSLGIYGDLSTGTYTGIPSIDLPLYTVAYRDIKVPISLSYHAAGIKVEQEASWVGLGWSLNAGGVITRTIRGLDDLTPISTKKGFPFIPDMPTECGVKNTPNLYVNFLQGNCNGTQDSEPDIFYFNIGGASGKFILEQNQSSLYQNELSATMLAKSKMKIKYKWQGTDKHLGTWTITNESGTIYTFDTKEFTFSATETNNTFENAEVKLKWAFNQFNQNAINNILRSTTGWYLSKIESPIGGLVSFIYADANQYATQSQWAYGMKRTLPSTEEVLASNVSTGTVGVCSSETPAELQLSISYSLSGSVHKEVYLKEIKFGDGSVKFNTSDRIDMVKTALSGYTAMANPQKLQSMVVSHSQSNNSITYNFDYDYFNNTGTVAEKRLKLLTLTQGDKIHRFEYDPQALPAKNSFDQDFWGFYNAPLVPNTSPLPQTTFQVVINGIEGVSNLKNLKNSVVASTDAAYRLPNAESMKAGVLTKIVYPTGGSTSYTYEAHRYQTEKIPLVVGQGQELSSSLSLSTSFYNQSAPLSKKFYVTQPTAVTYTAMIRCIDTNPVANCENAFLAGDLEKLAACVLAKTANAQCIVDSTKTVLSNTDLFYNDWKNCRTGQGANCYKSNSIVGDQSRGFQMISYNVVLLPGINYEMLINQGLALPSNLVDKFAIDINLQVTMVNPSRAFVFANEADIETQKYVVSTNPFTTGTLSRTFTITEPTFVRYEGSATCLSNLPNGVNNSIADCEAVTQAANDKPMFGIYRIAGGVTTGVLVSFFGEWKNGRTADPTGPIFLKEQPSMFLLPGTYAIQINTGNPLPTALQKFDIYASVVFANTPCKLTVTGNCGEKIGGGLRIKSISQASLNSPPHVRNFRYVNTDGSSSGKLMSKVIYYGYYQYVFQKKLVNNDCKFVKLGAYKIESAPTMPLGTSAQGNLVGYDRVLTIDGASLADNAQNGPLGASILEFKNQSDVLDYDAFLPNTPNTNYGNSNGLLTKTTLINQLGKKVSEHTNTYTRKSSNFTTGMRFQGFAGCSIVIVNDNSTAFSVNFRILENIGKKFYYTYSDFWALDSETSRTYNMNDDTKFIENTVNYNYSLADFKLKKTSTVSSAGKIQETQYFHTSDYSPSIPIVGQLMANNMYDKLLGERQLVSGNIISAKATEYNQQGLATNVHVLETAIPIAPSPSNILTFPLANVVPTELKKRMSFLYDTDNNLVEVQSISNNVIQNKTAYLWGYKGLFPVIEVQNASYASLGSGVLLNSSDVNTKASSLRSTLAKALVKSYTYDYLFGMLSTTTPNGLTNTFNYDTQGRLSTIRDPNNNLVKSYSYNYRNQ
jgi:YD repeat-containing protein